MAAWLRSYTFSYPSLQCWQPLQGGSLAAKNEDALEAIEDGHLNSENFFPLFPIFTIEDVGLSRDIIIVFGESLELFTSRSTERST